MCTVSMRLLLQKTDNYVYTPRDWVLAHRGVEFCEYCGKVRRELYPRSIDTAIAHPELLPTAGTTDNLRLGVMHIELRRLLQPWMSHFVFGRCLTIDGHVILTHVTFYSARYVVLQTTPDLYYDCERCGVRVGHWGDLPIRLAKEQLDGRQVVEDAVNGLYVSERLVQSIDWSRFPDLELLDVELVSSDESSEP